MSVQRLINNLESELDEMAMAVKLVTKDAQVLSEVEETEPRRWLTSAIALNLHSFYTGAERIFEQIAKESDGYLPTGANWHENLLKQMERKLTGIREAIISQETRRQLDEYRRFRHVARSNYAHKLYPERVLMLAQLLPGCYQQLERELKQFCQWLAQQPESLLD